MKNSLLYLLSAALLIGGCSSDDNPAETGPDQYSATGTFSTGNVKNTPVYFSFEKKDSTTSAQAWDLELTNTLMAVDPSIPPIKYPAIRLNRILNVTATMIDGTEYDQINPAAASGLKSDTNDTTLVIGANCLNYDGTTHRLSPFPKRTFVVKTTTGKLAKFQIVSYYNAAGASGYITFDYAVK